MIQFMKSRNDRYGEHVSAKSGIEIHTMGDGFTWDTKNPEQDRQTARETGTLRREMKAAITICWSLTSWFTSSYDMLPVAEVLEEIRAARELNLRCTSSSRPRRAERMMTPLTSSPND